MSARGKLERDLARTAVASAPEKSASTAIAIRVDDPELVACRNALGDIEILIYEAWEYDNTLTKDAARRFLGIAAICEWDMDWVVEMKKWVSR